MHVVQAAILGPQKRMLTRKSPEGPTEEAH